MKSKTLSWDNANDIALIAESLHRGHVVVGTTDTIPGLFADCTHHGFNELNRIKQRHDKPYIVLIDSQEKLYAIADVPHSVPIIKIIEQCWPGPLTLIFNKKPAALSFLPYGTIGIRIPAHEGILKLLKNFKGVFSTSANYAGQPAPQSLDEIDATLLAQAQYCISDDHQSHKPSTIIDCTSKEIKVIREGAYSIDEIQRIAQAPLAR